MLLSHQIGSDEHVNFRNTLVNFLVSSIKSTLINGSEFANRSQRCTLLKRHKSTKYFEG
jgi:hypothetical protein